MPGIEGRRKRRVGGHRIYIFYSCGGRIRDKDDRLDTTTRFGLCILRCPTFSTRRYTSALTLRTHHNTHHTRRHVASPHHRSPYHRKQTHTYDVTRKQVLSASPSVCPRPRRRRAPALFKPASQPQAQPGRSAVLRRRTRESCKEKTTLHVLNLARIAA